MPAPTSGMAQFDTHPKILCTHHYSSFVKVCCCSERPAVVAGPCHDCCCLRHDPTVGCQAEQQRVTPLRRLALTAWGLEGRGKVPVEVCTDCREHIQ